MSTALKGACIIGQSGGPSAVINASAYGVIKTALENENITKVYGAYHGIKGVLNDQLLVMDEEDPKELERLLYTPSSALGSCRYKIADPDEDETDYKRILEIFKKYNVRYFFYNGCLLYTSSSLMLARAGLRYSRGSNLSGCSLKN